jgi:hypothetical protein
MAMKTIALLGACALCLVGHVHAAQQPSKSSAAHGDVMELRRAHMSPARDDAPLSDLAVTRRDQIVTPLTHLPELPEPEVFAMMLVGLVLIGYRVSRDGGDKFS